jgi:hypothetical protein
MGGHREPMKDYEYELDKSTGEVVRRYVDMINNDGFKKVKALNYSPEFTYWYERIFCQSPSLSSLEYDDEKMWEAWKEGYKLGRNNAFKRKDCPPEIFTIPKEKHIHTMNEDKDVEL